MATRKSLHQTYDRFSKAVASCDTLGDFGSRRDVYGVLDGLLADLQQAMPPACRDGCHLCCYMLPLVTSAEWRPIHQAILASAPEVRTRIMAMADLLRPMAGKLRQMRQAALASPDVLRGQGMMQCPLLLDGHCTVYSVRPTVCRSFGQMAHTNAQGHSVFLGSDLALEHMKATMPEGVGLPSLDPYVRQVRQLNQRLGGTVAYLPQWLWAHVVDGTFVAEPLTDPVFP